jgi:hypothetical protein
LFGGLLAFSFLLSTVSIYSVWRADYDVPLDQMEHVRHRNFLNETVEIDGRDFEDCTFTNVKLMMHGKKSGAFHHGTFYGTVALTTDTDALFAFGEALWSLGMTSMTARERTRKRTSGFLENTLDKGGYQRNSLQRRRLNPYKISSRKSTEGGWRDFVPLIQYRRESSREWT